MKQLTDLSGRCGSCKWFYYFEKQDKLRKSGGHCYNPNRTIYHDASQKGCKLYQPTEDFQHIGKEN